MEINVDPNKQLKTTIMQSSNNTPGYTLKGFWGSIQ